MRGAPTLHATAASDAVVGVLRSGPRLGSIEAVFRRAVNVVVRAAPGGIVALLDEDLELPYGVTCAPPARGRMTELGLTAGMTVLLDGSGLVVPAAGLRIAIDAATRIDRVRLVPTVCGQPAAVAARARIARSLVGQATGGAGLAPLLDPGTLRSAFAARAEPLLASVTAALVAGDLARASAEGRALVGLGVGLTPSGDDALVGMVAALAATGHPAADAIARAWAADAAERTTSVGAALLRHAARLEFSGSLRSVLGAILDGEEAAVRRSVDVALSWGATSGTDTLVGVLAGLEVALERRGRSEAAA